MQMCWTHHAWIEAQSSFDSRCKGTRQSNSQWKASTGGQIELIIHEDVVKEKLVVDTWEQSFNKLFQKYYSDDLIHLMLGKCIHKCGW